MSHMEKCIDVCRTTTQPLETDEEEDLGDGTVDSRGRGSVWRRVFGGREDEATRLER
jgi:hypothetical protein